MRMSTLVTLLIWQSLGWAGLGRGGAGTVRSETITLPFDNGECPLEVVRLDSNGLWASDQNSPSLRQGAG